MQQNEIIPTETSLRKCRKCGCTENNCQQCIERTGAPCYWIAEDLCSACEETFHGAIEPRFNEGEADGLQLGDAQAADKAVEGRGAYEETVDDQPAGDGIQEPGNDLPPVAVEAPVEDVPLELPDGFFQGLAALGHVDLTMRAMQKGDEITVSLLPNNASKGFLMPLIATGTPAELDAELLRQFGAKLRLMMVEASKKLAEAANKEAAAPLKPAPAPSKTATKNHKKSAAKKPTAKKAEKKSAAKAPQTPKPPKEKAAVKGKVEKAPPPPKPEPRATALTLF